MWLVCMGREHQRKGGGRERNRWFGKVRVMMLWYLLIVVIFADIIGEEPRGEEISRAKPCSNCLCKGVNGLPLVGAILAREGHTVEKVVGHGEWRNESMVAETV